MPCSMVLALWAFFGSAGRSRVAVALLIFAFLCFAVVNYGGMRAVARQRLEACKILATEECGQNPVLIKQPFPITLDPPTITGVTVVHIGGDVMTIAAI